MAEDAIQSFLNVHGQSDAPNIPYEPPICCCGNSQCAYLKRNKDTLNGLERDVQTAARLGQALLVRHETYMADAEKERSKMAEDVDRLEGEKKSLERRNADVIEENRGLLYQLEAVNNSVAESDTQVLNLQATLRSTQQELQRLANLASRTEQLEQQLAEFEKEQAALQLSLSEKDEEGKSAIRRWRNAERTLASLQDQLERIEREANEERDRHSEIVGRMERRHAVERELDSAAGRLKGAAASKTADGSNNVVSHFVKDILQDNANLQMGIVELREMLQNSNDEVESLRRLMAEHQPAEERSRSKSPDKKENRNLRAELNRASSSELHVHHHYHAPSATRQSSTTRKPKKKRHGALTPGHFTPQSRSSTPRSSISYSGPSPAATILQQTAVSVPQPISHGKHWSLQSNQTLMSMLSTSGPGSPHSTHRTSSLYDRVFSDVDNDSSRPTTPATEDPGSPLVLPVHPKRSSLSSLRTKSVPIVYRRGYSPAPGRPSLDSIVDTSIENLQQLDQRPSSSDAIAEENELDWENEDATPQYQSSDLASPASEEVQKPIQEQDLYHRPLRRAASHESLLSISGMDIHTLKSRPSQMLFSSGGRAYTTAAVLSAAQAHAGPAMVSRPQGDSRHLLSGMAADQRNLAAGRPSLGKKVGGWVFGRWGASPETATASTVAASTSKVQKPPSVRSGSDKSLNDADATPKMPKLRHAGINQAGPIPGFGPEVRVQHPPIMKALDQDALSRILDGK